MTPTPSHKRLQKLKHLMREAGIDILAMVPGANLRYLTGGVHYVMERPIVLFIPLEGQSIAIIPQLEVPLFAKHSIEHHIISWKDTEGYETAFKRGFDMLQPAGKTIGIEGLRMRFFEGEIIRRGAFGAVLTEADKHIAHLRVIKEEEEINAMRTAISISEQALQRTLDEVRVGMSEIEIADILEAHMKSLGSEEPSFSTIVHGGGNSALPHSGPLPYRLQHGDPLLFDFGAVYQGYRADVTRTVFVGEPTKDFEAFYAVVKSANAAARAAAKPGVTAESVDATSRQILMDAGYEHLIRHRTGHGIGLETHEHPYIVLGNQQILEPGMMFTIEPGIYDMNRIGVRIEDDMLITEQGAESITSFNRDLTIIGA